MIDGYNHKKKIINDPVYGFFQIPHGLIYKLIEHPYFQRLRRIRQVGLTELVYPGALHTRFHHALGACHLSITAINTLRNKGVAITTDEAAGTAAAVLLHDIGHGPFSHTLEKTLLPLHHETLSQWIMDELNIELDGQLELAKQIFNGEYHKPFLHELVSGQLDVDRLDYLNRDSYFTGVSEGVIGYHRILKMLNVVDNHLVVEEKGIFSIENFLMARRLMYWQVYLHKTSLCAEVMLNHIIARAKHLAQKGIELRIQGPLQYFLYEQPSLDEILEDKSHWLEQFSLMDDFDVMFAIKQWVHHADPILSLLSSAIIQRKLFKIEMQAEPFDSTYFKHIEDKVTANYPSDQYPLEWLIFSGEESNQSYVSNRNEILILRKNGAVEPFSALGESAPPVNFAKRFYLCYPKIDA